jgi:hypothetical protein
MSHRQRLGAFLPAALAALLAACGDGPSDPKPGPTGNGVNLRIETAYIVQVTQNRQGTVPLVANRDAYVRVFVVADRANTAAPAVRVRLYQGETLRETLTIPADGASVPLAVDQGNLAASWDVKVPGSMIQPGLRMVADVDPSGAVAESNETDNTFPANGTPVALNVAAIAPLKVRFVPIHQRANGLVGRVTEANKHDFMTMTRKLHPIPGYDADVRAPYTVEGLSLDPAGNSWLGLVSELNTVRVAEGSDRYYYGVVQTEYPGGGVVGIAADIPSRTALGWDRPLDAAETVAHELGHNLGRFHAPCGGAGGADPGYPYQLGLIGVYGMDVETGELKAPIEHTDIMGYCDAKFWISDYNYTGIYNYLRSTAAASTAAQSSLLVWGSIRDGRVVLEPAFQVTTRPALPAAPGPYMVEGVDAAGEVVFSLSFAGDRVPDLEGDQRLFAFALPLSPQQMDRLATLRVVRRGVDSGAGGVTERRASLAAAPRASVARQGAERLSVRWDASAYPMAMVRDARTGEILALARGGTAEVRAGAGDVELVLSDGVRSSTRRIAAGGL